MSSADGRPIAYFYFDDGDEVRREVRKRMTRDGSLRRLALARTANSGAAAKSMAWRHFHLLPFSETSLCQQKLRRVVSSSSLLKNSKVGAFFRRSARLCGRVR